MLVTIAERPAEAMALVVRAYAKLNLTLEVLGRRPDGYHEITSVLQTVSLADVLSFTPAPTLSLRCSDPALASEDNLALRAAQLLRETAGCTEGAEITLEKHIPIASGLGGGSADAAAALWSLNQLWDLLHRSLTWLPGSARTSPSFSKGARLSLKVGAKGSLSYPKPGTPGSWWCGRRWRSQLRPPPSTGC